MFISILLHAKTAIDTATLPKAKAQDTVITVCADYNVRQLKNTGAKYHHIHFFKNMSIISIYNYYTQQINQRNNGL